MRVKSIVQCQDFPCSDVNHSGYLIPNIELDPASISLMMISEAAPVKPDDFYYSGPDALFQQTTLQAFHDAGTMASSMEELLELGVYFTTAVKCAKIGYAINTGTVERCSHLLGAEINLFPNVKVYMLMGDVAIKTFNALAKRSGEKRVIPAGSTYKIRGQEFFYKGRRVFPSYLQAGPSFFIEKSKRKMIAEDIAQAMQCVNRSFTK